MKQVNIRVDDDIYMEFLEESMKSRLEKDEYRSVSKIVTEIFMEGYALRKGNKTVSDTVSEDNVQEKFPDFNIEELIKETKKESLPEKEEEKVNSSKPWGDLDI